MDRTIFAIKDVVILKSPDKFGKIPFKVTSRLANTLIATDVVYGHKVYLSEDEVKLAKQEEIILYKSKNKVEHYSLNDKGFTGGVFKHWVDCMDWLNKNKSIR